MTRLALACLLVQNPIPLDGWRYVGGEEFPGARGSLAVEDRALRLEADFTGGGAYVGVWRELDLKGKDVKAVRFRLKASNVDRLGVRLGDETGQCHQGAVALKTTSDWQEVVLTIADLVGGEHWAGANDGKWHGPLKSLGLNVGKGGDPKKAVWIADPEAVLGSPIQGRPTLLTGVFDPPVCRAGYGTRLTYRWEAEPLGRDCSVFVHIQDAQGRTVQQADHGPDVATSVWQGKIQYTKLIGIPADFADGEYRFVAGIWDGRSRRPLKAGPGVVDLGHDAGLIGTLKVDRNAPLPALKAPTLDLSAFRITFAEEFDGPLSVSPQGPGTRWIAHTPYHGDFGDARFANPAEGFPFTTDKGLLRIEAKKTPQGWQAGLLSSADPKGNGFSQQYGYFEMRAKFPKGPGVWPAFWLMGVRGITDKSKPNPEVDVVEFYGAHPNVLTMTAHLWGPGKEHWAQGDAALVSGMTDDFHRYGALVDEKHLVWYFDGVELWRIPTPEAAKAPLYVMVNLALGGGWPIDKTPNPSVMEVDWVRVYAKK